ncbi:MAG: hypothetical protein SFZ23_00730 [Planctomycetota bacterium]|nr:hypothetical protein [Planctomycetota bacterium]
MLVRRSELLLFADYLQFYLQDDDESLGSLADAWTPEAVDRCLAVAPGVVGVGTVRNMTVPVTVEIFDAEPPDPPLRPDQDQAAPDLVTQTLLEVQTGRIVVAGCTDYFPDAIRIPLPPGMWNVRASSFALDTLRNNDLEGDDHYLVQLWPAPTASRTQGNVPTVRVLKPRS